VISWATPGSAIIEGDLAEPETILGNELVADMLGVQPLRFEASGHEPPTPVEGHVHIRLHAIHLDGGLCDRPGPRPPARSPRLAPPDRRRSTPNDRLRPRHSESLSPVTGL